MAGGASLVVSLLIAQLATGSEESAGPGSVAPMEETAPAGVASSVYAIHPWVDGPLVVSTAKRGLDRRRFDS
jgi:hypothetical protein